MRPSSCRAFNADLRINVPAHGLYTYADASVVCGPLQFGEDPEGIVNPAVIVEVLSPSSEGYDRGKKFEMYRSLESFREYLIVHQDRRHIEHYSKQADGSWILRDCAGHGATVHIAWMRVTIALDDLYAGTQPEV